tara:strand:+ start:217 stop:447 length:231 start_codon:yes stop_codon:yes gene_type:complete
MLNENNKLPKFKPGNLVRVKDSTHEQALPDHRLGLVMETVPEEIDESRSYTAFYNVAFTGGKILKFHEMFLELVED